MVHNCPSMSSGILIVPLYVLHIIFMIGHFCNISASSPINIDDLVNYDNVN